MSVVQFAILLVFLSVIVGLLCPASAGNGESVHPLR